MSAVEKEAWARLINRLHDKAIQREQTTQRKLDRLPRGLIEKAREGYVNSTRFIDTVPFEEQSAVVRMRWVRRMAGFSLWWEV